MPETTDTPVHTHLTFYIPGLFDPLKSGDAHDGPWRALETLLSRADIVDRGFPQGYEEGLFALYGLVRQENSDLPVAAVTRMIDMGVIDNDWWLRADPVHLSLDRDRLILADARKLDVTPDEASRLVAEIMEVFTADGWLLKAPHPERWYLKTGRSPNMTTSSMSKVVGRDVHGFLPRGPDDKAWHTILNEIQILLHTATVNVERENAGKLPINSLWFWGSGRLPRIKPVAWTQVWSNEPVSLSLAKLSSTPVDNLPDDYDGWRQRAEKTGEHLLVLDEAHPAALYNDLTQWQEILRRLESAWMAPLLHDLKSGAIQRVTLMTDAGVNFTLTSRQACRWWRRRHSLSSHRQV